jgi:hypothetical protein
MTSSGRSTTTHKLPKQLQENLPTAEQLEMDAAIREIGVEQSDSPL